MPDGFVIALMAVLLVLIVGIGWFLLRKPKRPVESPDTAADLTYADGPAGAAAAAPAAAAPVVGQPETDPFDQEAPRPQDSPRAHDEAALEAAAAAQTQQDLAGDAAGAPDTADQAVPTDSEVDPFTSPVRDDVDEVTDARDVDAESDAESNDGDGWDEPRLADPAEAEEPDAEAVTENELYAPQSESSPVDPAPAATAADAPGEEPQDGSVQESLPEFEPAPAPPTTPEPIPPVEPDPAPEPAPPIPPVEPAPAPEPAPPIPPAEPAPAPEPAPPIPPAEPAPTPDPAPPIPPVEPAPDRPADTDRPADIEVSTTEFDEAFEEAIATARAGEPEVGAFPEPEFAEGGFGPTSAQPAVDGTGPRGWEVKGTQGSMLFHTPESPSYDQTRADVWFESETAATDAGFAHWDRKRR